MFNGMMMDPEMMRLAQEQMSRMSPADLARIQQQMMSNPDLLRMASESMKNMRPEDMKFAAEQLKRTCPEQMAEISKKMANASPEEMAAMRSHLDSQTTYAINAAEMLKKQGNELHSQGRFCDASEKYLLAKKNVEGIPVSTGRSLLLACSLNLMSCYLKTSQFDECIREGSEVLEYDSNNVKALYRRGQAYKELAQLENAVADLSKAREVSPDDETIPEVLRDAKERLLREGAKQTSRGTVIEELSGEGASVSLEDHESSVDGTAVSHAEDKGDCLKTHQETPFGPSTGSESVKPSEDDTESIRKPQDSIKVDNNHVGESSWQGLLGSRSVPQSSSTTSTADLQEQMRKQMRKQMRDPDMQQMFSSMMKSISPEMMSSMSKQFGVELSQEDAQKAHQAMSSCSPEDFDRMMKWADRLQSGAETAMKTKNWLLGRRGMILAVVVLLLAAILAWFGYHR